MASAAPLPEFSPAEEPLLAEHQLPHNLEAEQGVLGGLLLAPDRFHLVEGRVEPSDFFNPAYGEIFDAMVDGTKRGQPIDILVLKDTLQGRDKLEFIGGYQTLDRLLDAAPTGAHVEFYAQIVRDKSLQRRLIAAATEIVQKATGHSGEPTTSLLDFAEKVIFDVAERGVTGEARDIRDILHEAWDQIEANSNDHGTVTGLATDYYEFDQKLTGLHPDELIIVAGRPSMGKSTFALNLTRRVAVEHKQGAIIYSLEMSSANIAQNMLCAHARLDAQRLRTGKLSTEEWQHLVKSTDALSQAPIFIDDTPSISLAELRGKSRRLKARHDIKLIVVDYLQLMTASAQAASRSREQEISEISRGLKALAKELSVPVIALSQLNRKAEGRSDNRPVMSDLRESGAIEQDADVVILLHRPDYYDKTDSPGEAEIIIAKQRNGPTGTVNLAFIGDKLLFENLSPRRQEFVEDGDGA